MAATSPKLRELAAMDAQTNVRKPAGGDDGDVGDAGDAGALKAEARSP